LRLIQRLTGQLGLNLAGVETVLRLEDELAKMQNRLDRMEREMRDRIRRVEREYKREVVLYRAEGETKPDTSWTFRSSR
jgi:MerR family transcriptional regulator/heat shock protein HspR